MRRAFCYAAFLVETVFRLKDSNSALAFLKLAPLAQRRRGEVLFNSGNVLDFTCVETGVFYTGRVEDQGEIFEAELNEDPDEGWVSACDCGDEYVCPHVCALMLTLLAEHNATLVRELSAGDHRGATDPGTQSPRSNGQGTDVRTRLRAALGRELNRKEEDFVRKFQALYRQFQLTRRLTGWDLDRLGIIVARETWGLLPLGPDVALGEYDFWLHVATYLCSIRAPIPSFMAAITDVSEIEQKSRYWRRMAEVEDWKRKLARVPDFREADTGGVQDETDLRLVVGVRRAEIQMQESGAQEFRPLRTADIRRFQGRFYDKEPNFTVAGEILWNLAQSVLEYGAGHLDYSNSAHRQILSRMLRSQALAPCIKNEGGDMLPRSSEPLRWELTPPETPDGDYTFRLSGNDGSPPPEIYCSLPGSSWLYLTSRGLVPGPAQNPGVLDAHKETRIPAAALENAPGVSFLQAHAIPLPPALSARVRVFHYEIDIACQLRVGQFGSKEECFFIIQAQTADGGRLTWDGWNWNNQKGAVPAESAEFIPVRDSSRLTKAAEFLNQLKLKASTRDRKLMMRVTKKFPEILTGWIKTLPPYVHVHLKGELATLGEVDVAGRVKLEVTETEIDWFDLRVVLDVADNTLTPQELRLLLGAKGNYVRLEGKGWRRLKFELTEDENERLARLGLSPQEMSDEPQRLHALQLADPAARKFLPEEHVEKIQRRASELKARVAPNLPSGITAELRPYQLEGFHFLAYLATNHFGGILADDMGLGKTLQTLAWILWLREQETTTASGSAQNEGGDAPRNGEMSPSLVVCPKSVMDNWHAEAGRFTPGLRVKIWSPGELEGFAEGIESAQVARHQLLPAPVD